MSMSSYRRTAFHHANSSFTPVNALVWMVLRLSVVGAGGDFQIPISLFGRTMGRVGRGGLCLCLSSQLGYSVAF